MKIISQNTMSFPIVIKRVVNDMVLSVPDLGIFKNFPIPPEETASESSKSSTLGLSDNFKQQIIQGIEELWIKTETHRNEKKWQPSPSTFKQSLQAGEEDYSLPEFVKKLNEFISVSENTIRREIGRGVIRCYQTEGRHRRIPVSELSNYLQKVETTNKMMDV